MSLKSLLISALTLMAASFGTSGAVLAANPANYPAAAMVMDQEGWVLLSCEAGPQSLLQNCTVKDEAPGGYGFGEASVARATGKRVGKAPGERIEQVVIWRLEGGAYRLKCWTGEVAHALRTGEIEETARGPVETRIAAAALEQRLLSGTPEDALRRVQQQVSAQLARKPWPSMAAFDAWRVCNRLHAAPEFGVARDREGGRKAWAGALKGMLDAWRAADAEFHAALAEEVAAGRAEGVVGDVKWVISPDVEGPYVYVPWTGATVPQGPILALQCQAEAGGVLRGCGQARRIERATPGASRLADVRTGMELLLATPAALHVGLLESRIEPLPGQPELTGKTVRLRFEQRPRDSADTRARCWARQIPSDAFLFVGGQERLLKERARELRKAKLYPTDAAAHAVLSAELKALLARPEGLDTPVQKENLAWCKKVYPTEPTGFW